MKYEYKEDWCKIGDLVVVKSDLSLNADYSTRVFIYHGKYVMNCHADATNDHIALSGKVVKVIDKFYGNIMVEGCDKWWTPAMFEISENYC